jgi:hypothetical protein
MQELLQSFKWEVLSDPPHSSDLPPSDCHLFCKLKESLAGKTSLDDNDDDDELQDMVMAWLTDQVRDFYDAVIKKTRSQAN